ncbi:MAG: hypothetical protein ACRDVN_12435 [Jiangellaceae bacterium]
MAGDQVTKQVSTFCPLCVSRCGAKATIDDGTFVALEPDPSHPTGPALCVKGKAAPEIVYHPERLLCPLKRTNRKGATASAEAGRALSPERAPVGPQIFGITNSYPASCSAEMMSSSAATVSD